MKISINNKTNQPIYEQIASQIEEMMMNGELQRGDTIPSVRDLAQSLHVSIMTVQKAYEELQKEGLIESTIGKGSFVSGKSKEYFREKQRCFAEKHLQAAAQIGRISSISIEKMIELLNLFYYDYDVTTDRKNITGD